jgi:hypothetical protein
MSGRADRELQAGGGEGRRLVHRGVLLLDAHHGLQVLSGFLAIAQRTINRCRILVALDHIGPGAEQEVIPLALRRGSCIQNLQSILGTGRVKNRDGKVPARLGRGGTRGDGGFQEFPRRPELLVIEQGPAHAGQQAVFRCCAASGARRLLPTAFCQPPPPHCLLPSAFCLLPTALCLPPTALCLPPSAFCLLPTALITFIIINIMEIQQ